MTRVTSKLQVTIPKAIAERYGIEPGKEIDWVPAGDAIRVVPPEARLRRVDPELRLRLYDQATERQRQRQQARPPEHHAKDRGWTREDLYDRDSAD